jgi:hypothetical protein
MPDFQKRDNYASFRCLWSCTKSRLLNNDEIKKEVLGVFAGEIYRSFRHDQVKA